MNIDNINAAADRLRRLASVRVTLESTDWEAVDDIYPAGGRFVSVAKDRRLVADAFLDHPYGELMPLEWEPRYVGNPCAVFGFPPPPPEWTATSLVGRFIVSRRGGVWMAFGIDGWECNGGSPDDVKIKANRRYSDQMAKAFTNIGESVR